ADLRVVIRRDGLIGLAEVEEDGAARLLGRGLGDAGAVGADGAAHAGDARGREPGERAAQAVADHADLEALSGERTDGRADVLDHVVDVDLAADAAPALDVGGLVAGVKAALGAGEDGRRQGDVAVGGEAVGYVPDVGVDAEDLLDDDEAGLRFARRRGA